MLSALGMARLGALPRRPVRRPAPWCCAAALLLLFVALPVAKALAGAFLDEDGQRLARRAGSSGSASERIWGLGCLAGGVRCGVAWNTLFLALLTAAGTTVLGTLIALMAERGSQRAGAAAATCWRCCRSSRRRSWSAWA